jgi:hypothetical protein
MVLFNLHRVLITGARAVIVVEGFFDALNVHQAGCRAVVALMGSTLSRPQADVLTRHFDRVRLMLDGDDAGRQGTAAGMFALASRLDLIPVALDEGTQPITCRPRRFNAWWESTSVCSMATCRSRQRPDPQAIPSDRYDRAVGQIVGDGGQIRQQQRGLVGGPAGCAMPKQDDRRLPLRAQREERVKIGIGRDDHTRLGDGEFQNHVIGGFAQPAIAHMDRIVS